MTLECTLEATVEGGAVEFALSVVNAGDEPVELRFPDARTHDVAVRTDGTEVWRWSDGRMFGQALASEALDAGETRAYRSTWADPDPGEYEALGTLAARNADCEARTALAVA